MPREFLKFHLNGYQREHKPQNQCGIHRIHVFFGLLDPDPLVRDMDPDPALDPDPDPSIIMQK